MKSFFSRLLLVTSLALLSAASCAQYPDKPVKLIVPFAPGGVVDIAARVVAQGLSKGLGQQIIIDNRAGAAGTMGLEAAAKSPADGYTLALGTTGTLASAPALYPSLGYDPLRSFAPISQIVTAPFLVFVHSAVPANTLRELIDLAKARPGQLNFASAGNGGPPHVAGEMFKTAAEVDIVHIPYKVFATAVVDVASGRVQLAFNQLAPFQPHVQSGKVKILAIASAARLRELPEVPTTAEAGLPGYEVSIWSGLLAPRGTPDEIIKRLNHEVLKALATAEVRDTLRAQGFEPTGSSPENFLALIGSESAKWSRAIRISGAKLD